MVNYKLKLSPVTTKYIIRMEFSVYAL
jgi:hypothetical protein